MDRFFCLKMWCHASPAPDKVRGCNAGRASLRSQAGRGRSSICWRWGPEADGCPRQSGTS